MALSCIKVQTIRTSLGDIVIGETGGKLCLCVWASHSKRSAIEHRLQRLLKMKFLEMESDLLVLAASEINEYIGKKRTSFSIPTLFVGSDFQLAVWRKICDIEYGQRKTYQEIAHELNKDTSFRVIASTISTSPLALIIPSHRVKGEKKTTATVFEDKANEYVRIIEKERLSSEATVNML